MSFEIFCRNEGPRPGGGWQLPAGHKIPGDPFSPPANQKKVTHPAALTLIFFFFFFVFCPFRATPMAFGDSGARGQIGATAARLYHNHSNARS